MTSKRLMISINSCWNFVNFRSGLLRALVSNGYEVVAVAPEDAYCDRLTALGCRFIALPFKGRGVSPFHDMLLFLRYLRLMRAERPHVFLGYTVKPNVYGSLAAHILGIPVINNIAGLGTTFLSRGWLNRVVRQLYRTALSRSTIVFFQNPDDLKMFVDDALVPTANARLLPGSGIDTASFAPGAAVERKQSDGFTFLLVARMLWAKGVGDLVEASAAVRRALPNVRVQVVGIVDEASRGAIPRRIIDGWVDAGLIEFLGRADDVRPFISAADCVVLPTYYPEGTPRFLLEGAAMGKPLITTDVPGCREVVEDGVNGSLCRPRDPGDLERAMLQIARLSEEDRAVMGRASRRKAEREFDEKIVIADYLEALSYLPDGARNGRPG